MKTLKRQDEETLILACFENDVTHPDSLINCLDELLFLLDGKRNHMELLLPTTLNPPILVQ